MTTKYLDQLSQLLIVSLITHHLLTSLLVSRIWLTLVLEVWIVHPDELIDIYFSISIDSCVTY